MKNKKVIFLVVGRSASGKTSITKEACKRLGLKIVKSYTTRPMRDGETEENTDHYFINEKQANTFLDDDLAATTIIKGYKYFATKSELEHANVYVIDPNGIKDLKERYKNDFEFVTVYVRVPPLLALKRATDRGDDLQKYHERIKDENEQFLAFEKEMPWDYHLLNSDTFERGVDIMMKFMTKVFDLQEN